MRIITLIIGCFTLMLVMDVFGQDEMPKMPIDEETKTITYSEVINVDSSITKSELYSRGREWFAKAYKSSTDVIQMEDRESGKIIGKALMVVYHKALGMALESGQINYTISLYCKDGRYKYEVTDFIHTSNYESGRVKTSCDRMTSETRKMYRKVYTYYLIQLDENIRGLIADLKNSMNVKSTKKNKDDW